GFGKRLKPSFIARLHKIRVVFDFGRNKGAAYGFDQFAFMVYKRLARLAFYIVCCLVRGKKTKLPWFGGVWVVFIKPSTPKSNNPVAFRGCRWVSSANYSASLVWVCRSVPAN